MHRIYWLAIVFWATYAQGQHHEPFVVGADATATGYTSLTRLNAFSACNNQGALPFVEAWRAGAFAQRLFLLEGLEYAVVSAVVPTDAGGFGLAVSHFGYEQFSEQQFRLGYGRKLAANIGMGIGFTGLRTQMGEYGSALAFTAELGLYYQISDAVTLATHVFNPMQTTLVEESTPVPSTLAIGIQYQSTASVSLFGEVEKNWQQPLSVRGGLEYTLSEHFRVRAGTQSQPVQFTFGMGIQTHPLQIDLAYAYHPVLGSTPMLSLQFVPKEKSP